MTLKLPQKFTYPNKFHNIYNRVHIIVLALIFTACGTAKDVAETVKDQVKEELETIVNPSEPVHVAFAGGGWRAHTAHSAWTIGLLDQKHTLNEVFKNVEIISSNSGGSWFSSMLMYSSDFVNDIQDPNAQNKWTTSTGWTYKQKVHFDNAGCNYDPRGIYLECVFDKFTDHSYTGGTYWKLLVDKLIYKDYPLDTLKLNDQHLPWARNKALLMASSLLTNTVVLNGDSGIGGDVRYYQTCLSPNTPYANLSSPASCSNNVYPADATPATFSSTPSGMRLLPSGKRFIPSPFFAELGTDLNSKTFHLGYTSEQSKPPLITQPVTNPLKNGDVLVMTAAAASSAAGGFAASQHVTRSYDAGYIFQEDAVSFSLMHSEVEYIDAETLNLPTLYRAKVVRLADGGLVDNSGVAQLVRSLQLNDKDTNFNIVAFDNVSEITHPIGGGVPVGIDIASLFGEPDKLCKEYRVLGKKLEACITTPKLQIFEKGPLNSTASTWRDTLQENNGNYLIYTQYKVTTKENLELGIKGGSKGTVHSFTCSFPSAVTAPYHGDIDFKAYHLMFNFIVDGLTHNGGLEHLRTALGLSNE